MKNASSPRNLIHHGASAQSSDAVTITIPVSFLVSGILASTPAPVSNPSANLTKIEKAWLQQQIETIRRKARKSGFKIQKVRGGGFRVLDPDTAEIMAGEAGDGIPIAEAWDYIVTNRAAWSYDQDEGEEGAEIIGDIPF